MGNRGARQSDPVEIASFNLFQLGSRQFFDVAVLVHDELFEVCPGGGQNRGENVPSTGGAGPENPFSGDE